MQTIQDTNSRTMENIQINNKPNKEIYRFKFSTLMMKHMTTFSNLHKLEDKKEFKESFNNWYDENNEIIRDEIKSLIDKGFQGDEEKIKNKMYRSVRYYYKKKAENPNTNNKNKDELEKEEENNKEDNVTPTSTKTKQSIRFFLPEDIIKTMDRYILENNKKPSVMFEEFMNVHLETLEKIDTLQHIQKKGKNYEKLKKSFKNRCYKAHVCK